MQRGKRIAFIMYSYLHFWGSCFFRGFFFAHGSIKYELLGNRPIWLIDGILTGTMTSGQSWPGCNSNEGVLHNFKGRSLIIRSNWVSYLGHHFLEGSDNEKDKKPTIYHRKYFKWKLWSSASCKYTCARRIPAAKLQETFPSMWNQIKQTSCILIKMESSLL